MKGLLHRLADRAAGASPTVHSDARLPFGADRLGKPDVPRPVDDGANADEPSTSPRTVEPAMTETSETPAEMSNTTRSGPPIKTHVAMNGAPSWHEAPSSARSLPLRSSPSSPRPSSGVETPDTVQRRSHTFAADPFDAPHTNPDLPAPAIAPRETVETMFEPEAPRPIAAMRAPPEDAQRHPAKPARVTLVAQAPAPLLLPSDVRPESLPQDLSPFGDGHSSPTEERAADDATEVHVHIGRIEVTAVQEAPTPRPRRDKRQAPVSLDAYLAARAKS